MLFLLHHRNCRILLWNGNVHCGTPAIQELASLGAEKAGEAGKLVSQCALQQFLSLGIPEDSQPLSTALVSWRLATHHLYWDRTTQPTNTVGPYFPPGTLSKFRIDLHPVAPIPAEVGATVHALTVQDESHGLPLPRQTALGGREQCIQGQRRTFSCPVMLCVTGQMSEVLDTPHHKSFYFSQQLCSRFAIFISGQINLILQFAMQNFHIDHDRYNICQGPNVVKLLQL